MKAGWTEVALGEVVTEMRSGFASGEDTPGGVLQIRMNNVTPDGSWDFAKERRLPVTSVSERFQLDRNDILFNHTNSAEVVGKSALFAGRDEPVVFSNHFFRIRTDQRLLLPGFLARWLHLQRQRGVFTSMAQRWVNQAAVRPDRLASLKVVLPTLEEQRRITRILDSAADLRTLRHRWIRQSESVSRSAYVKSVDDARIPVARLGEIAEISSGITKGRKTHNSELANVPYLAVSNVQDGHLDLTTVKTIAASESERERYRLRTGDLVLTEGGDPDKLGRGAIWSGEIDSCIHQNHIFRVRVDDPEVVRPIFLRAQIASPRARAYFLRSAKQTTGIASINKTQLSDLPILIPEPSRQAEFVAAVNALDDALTAARFHRARLDALFASLQHRAFAGDL